MHASSSTPSSCTATRSAGAGSASSSSTTPGRRSQSPAPNGTGPSASATSAIAASCAVNVFVAGTARSSPASSETCTEALRASGLSGSLVTATVRAPAPPKLSRTDAISGVRPDWLMPTASQPSTRGRTP